MTLSVADVRGMPILTPVTLIFDLDLYIVKMYIPSAYQKWSLYVKAFNS